MQSNPWLFIGIFLIIAPIFPIIAALIIPRLLAPRKPNRIKEQTYECGIETVGDTWVQFKVQYYIYALIFLIFDVELVFLFPGQYRLTSCPCLRSLKGCCLSSSC